MTLTDGKTIKKTTAMRGENRAVEWDEKLDALSHQSSLIPCLN